MKIAKTWWELAVIPTNPFSIHSLGEVDEKDDSDEEEVVACRRECVRSSG